ncbi:hypothetical protein BCR42DRAFT_487861 [Absidia repens]|uniref:Uncharacterized protein n=1 Tax=Absidia repens TaxID=90262 RepID=A0A1X2IU45_9FUNG|nr:hypothetical protein BCR42DRAFT_487861 [Absidia repens]
MILKLRMLWNILIPIIILSIIINIVPFIIHIRLRNWSATVMTLLFALYGVLITINAFINCTIPIFTIMQLSPVYWFCWTYDLSISIIKIACTGCYLRLLNRLFILLQKTASAQQPQPPQRHTLLSVDSDQHATNIFTVAIRRFRLIISPSSDDNDIYSTRTNKKQLWKIKLLYTKNKISLWYQDQHLLLWDIIFILVLPIVYMLLSLSINLQYPRSKYSDDFMHYIYYSPSLGLLIAIKIKKLRFYFNGRSSDQGSDRLPFYRVFIFCCLYNLLYVVHLPFIVPTFMSVIKHHRIPISEEGMQLSRNGLILKEDKTLEVIPVFVYPLLSLFWALFFGTTQQAYNIYKAVWYWWKNAWCGKQRTMNDQGRDHGNQQPQEEATAQGYTSPQQRNCSETTTTLYSHGTTIIPLTIPHSAFSQKDTSLHYDDRNSGIRSIDRRAFSSIPYFSDRRTSFTNDSAYSTIDPGSTSATGSSVTLINHRSY